MPAPNTFGPMYTPYGSYPQINPIQHEPKHIYTSAISK